MKPAQCAMMAAAVVLELLPLFAIYSFMTALRPDLDHSIDGDPLPLHVHKAIPEEQYTGKEYPLFVFAQVSDLHLSKYSTAPLENLNEMIHTVLPAARPEMVIVSGDLTDGISRDMRSHRMQHPSEWKQYAAAIQSIPPDVLPLVSSGQREDALREYWFDIRGNHDVFGETSIRKEIDTKFTQYSVSGRHGRGPFYVHTVQRPFGGVRFVFADFVADRGLARHFYGEIEEEDRDFLHQALVKGENEAMILVGHFPLGSTVGAMAESVLDRPYIAHLSGHLHTLGQPSHTRLHGRRTTQQLELELGDLKRSRVYRIAALDHGLFSFDDFTLGTFPAAFITNPKDARYLSPFEPLHVMSKISTINLIAFTISSESIDRIFISIDEQVVFDSRNISHLRLHDSNLFQIPWSPIEYHRGAHKLSFQVTDSTNSSFSKTIPFSLDGTAVSLPRRNESIITSDWYSFTLILLAFHLVFLTGLFIIPFCITRFTSMDRFKTSAETRLSREILGVHAMRGSNIHILWEWIVSRIYSMLYRSILFAQRFPIMAGIATGYGIYATCGPSFVGPFMAERHWAVMSPFTIWAVEEDGIHAYPSWEASFTVYPVLLWVYWPAMHLITTLCLQKELVAQKLVSVIWTVKHMFYLVVVALGSFLSIALLSLMYGVPAAILSPSYLWLAVTCFVIIWYVATSPLPTHRSKEL